MMDVQVAPLSTNLVSIFASAVDGVDRRKAGNPHVAHRLNDKEHRRLLLSFNVPPFAALAPGPDHPDPAQPWPLDRVKPSVDHLLDAIGRAGSSSVPLISAPTVMV